MVCAGCNNLQNRTGKLNTTASNPVMFNYLKLSKEKAIIISKSVKVQTIEVHIAVINHVKREKTTKLS